MDPDGTKEAFMIKATAYLFIYRAMFYHRASINQKVITFLSK